MTVLSRCRAGRISRPHSIILNEIITIISERNGAFKDLNILKELNILAKRLTEALAKVIFWSQAKVTTVHFFLIFFVIIF